MELIGLKIWSTIEFVIFLTLLHILFLTDRLSMSLAQDDDFELEYNKLFTDIDEEPQTEINVAFVLPYSDFYYARRKLTGPVISKTNSFGMEKYPISNFGTKFKTNTEFLYMQYYNPSEIIKNICNNILKRGTVNTVVFASAGDLTETYGALRMAVQIVARMGIPVIAWDGDGTGFSQVSTS